MNSCINKPTRKEIYYKDSKYTDERERERERERDDREREREREREKRKEEKKQGNC
jgi:hypothetical protein